MCWWLILWGGSFAISGFWIILFWFIIDAWQAIAGSGDGTAYWAHLGGFIFGFGLGTLCLSTGLARMATYDNPTLLDFLAVDTSKTENADSRNDRPLTFKPRIL